MVIHCKDSFKDHDLLYQEYFNPISISIKRFFKNGRYLQL